MQFSGSKRPIHVSSWVIAVVALAVCAINSPAQTRKNPKGIGVSRHGSIERDAYLVFMNGEMKQAAGQTVYLLQATNDTYDRMVSVCRDAGSGQGNQSARGEDP